MVGQEQGGRMAVVLGICEGCTVSLQRRTETLIPRLQQEAIFGNRINGRCTEFGMRSPWSRVGP